MNSLWVSGPYDATNPQRGYKKYQEKASGLPARREEEVVSRNGFTLREAEEPGKLEEVARLAPGWFTRCLDTASKAYAGQTGSSLG